MAVLEHTARGLYCPGGDFYIDPWQPAARAVITHAHADHARWGHQSYLATSESAAILRHRLGDIPLQTLEYGESLRIGAVQISLHPAGHIRGSAQLRVAQDGEVWVVSGDYKRQPDPTCAAFAPQRCHVFISEATFGYPVYRWPPFAQVIAQIRAWRDECAVRGEAAVLFCYALGKAQRILHALADETEPVLLHGAMQELTQIYRDAGVRMAPTAPALLAAKPFAGRLILAPPSAAGTPWMRRFGAASTAFASGWMQVRGNRRRRGHDRGFVISDHADWPGLLQSLDDCGAERVLLTHGDTAPLLRLLGEQGRSVATLAVPPREADAEDAA